MKVRFKRLHKDAVVPYKTHGNDFCYDCVATSMKEEAPNVWRYGLGFAIQAERDTEHPFELISFDIRPRSSVWKTGMVLSNSEGTVDEGYIGEVSVVFYHVMTDMPKYKVGDRVCQLKIGFSEDLEFVEADGLENTERGEGREGSTGR